jgi:disulfide bond formation protein DsbB
MLAPPSLASHPDSALARGLALATPLALLGGALVSQYGFGLLPCEMCWWQRYPHAAAILLAGLAFTAPAEARRARLLTLLAALAIAVSGAIGVYHAGVEYGWWQGITTCSSSGARSLDDIMAVPLIRCDQVQWSLGGVSLAGFNALFSLGAAAVITWLLGRSRRTR